MNKNRTDHNIPITPLNNPYGIGVFNQRQLIYQYNIDTRERFNSSLFIRDDDAIIQELLNVIKICQRSEQFKIVLQSYIIVDNPIEVHKILREDEERRLQSRSKSKRKKGRYLDNQYEFIPLNDTDLKLLLVEYYLEVNGESDILKVIIAVPKVVQGNSFRLMGKLYVPMYQVVESSTYNNIGTDSVTLKTMFGIARIYREFKQMKCVDGEEIESAVYMASIFGKKLNAYKFLLGKFGLLDTLKFMGLEEINFFNEYRESDLGTNYIFNKGDIYIRVPRYIFDNDLTTQSFIYAIYSNITRNTEYEEIFTKSYWTSSLGEEFGNKSISKGNLILESLEGLYDISTMRSIALPNNEKGNIFLLWRWLIREFGGLKVKDNLDMRTNKIRYAEYIASYYALKVSRGIHRISDHGKNATLNNLKRALNTDPMILIKSISKSTLRMYRNTVNDLDSVEPLKFTFKGEGGIVGAGSNKSPVPDTKRAIYPEYIGKLDLDTSSGTDPGMTGVLCPYLKLKDGTFADSYEPLEWEAQYQDLVLKYRDMIGRKEVLEFKNQIVGYKSDIDELLYLKAGLNIINNLINPIRKVKTMTEEGLLIPYMVEQ